MVINGDPKQQTFIRPVAKIICAVIEKNALAISNCGRRRGRQFVTNFIALAME